MGLGDALTPFPYSAPYCAEGNDVHGRCVLQHQPVYLNSQLAQGWSQPNLPPGQRVPGGRDPAFHQWPQNAPHDRRFERIPPYCRSLSSWLCQIGL